MKSIISILIIVLMFSGCASTRGTGSDYRPLVDTKDHDMAKLTQDTEDCQAYARQVAGAADQAAAGAAFGAVFGALIMAAVGGSSRDGAWVGALSGGVSGAGKGEHDQRTVISRCLVGRGYNVLN